MEFTIREYTEHDYAKCEELVNQAWQFDTIFQPEALAKIAKKMYTGGSVAESTYRAVAEVDGEVVGFIFGLNEYTRQRRSWHLGLRLSILWGLLTLKSSTPDKSVLLNAMAEHERNKSALVNKKRSEIVLFVVDDNYQGQGVGKALWAGFLENCLETGVLEIIVETNQQGAASFYETIGFQHLANFHSPLHEFATPNGQACIYKYLGD